MLILFVAMACSISMQAQDIEFITDSEEFHKRLIFKTDTVTVTNNQDAIIYDGDITFTVNFNNEDFFGEILKDGKRKGVLIRDKKGNLIKQYETGYTTLVPLDLSETLQEIMKDSWKDGEKHIYAFLLVIRNELYSVGFQETLEK